MRKSIWESIAAVLLVLLLIMGVSWASCRKKKAGETAAFPYTIAGVNAADETDVDVIGIIGDWTAEVVPTDNASGVLNVTATTGASAKISVYAANHKGKTGGDNWAIFDEYDTPLGGQLLINHVGDCFD